MPERNACSTRSALLLAASTAAVKSPNTNPTQSMTSRARITFPTAFPSRFPCLLHAVYTAMNV